MYQLNKVSLSHGQTTILHDLSLSIEEGECVALIGRSGAGKSTLLRYLYEQKSSQAAWIPQAAGLVNNLSVYHNVYMGRLQLYPAWRNLVNLFRPYATDKLAIKSILSSLEFEKDIFSDTEALSGGQQQRVAIARALYQGRDLILADEPSSAIDPRHARRVMAHLKSSSKTLILALHDIHLALEVADRIVGISDGKIVLDNATSNLAIDDLQAFYGD